MTWGSSRTLAGLPTDLGLEILAAAGSSPLDPTDPTFWASFGILGLFLLCLFKRWLIPGFFYEQEVKRRQDAESLNDTLRQQVAEQTQVMNEVSDRLAWLIERQEEEDGKMGIPRRPPRQRKKPLT